MPDPHSSNFPCGSGLSMGPQLRIPNESGIWNVEWQRTPSCGRGYRSKMNVPGQDLAWQHAGLHAGDVGRVSWRVLYLVSGKVPLSTFCM